MHDNILEAITKQYHTFTKSGKILADYIYKHFNEAQYMSISTLAERSGVSEATITRFCHGLGLSGYNEFKLALAKVGKTTDLGEPAASPENIASADTLSRIFQKIHVSNIASLNETMELLDERQIKRAVDYLSAANRVFCFGQGGSMVMAMEAWARFSTATPSFVHISDTHMQVIAASLGTSNDAILFFSYSGSTRDMEDVLQTAKNSHIPVILITHFPRSRAADFADVILLCGFNESPLQSGSISAKVGQMFLIECLFYAYCKKNPELFAKARATTAEAVAKKLL